MEDIPVPITDMTIRLVRFIMHWGLKEEKCLEECRLFYLSSSNA
jgi:hypothetical protein